MLVFLFYLFSFVLVLSSIAVILSTNPVYAVFFLILTFFNAAALFLLLKAEFIAMLIVIVYVGAIAVLFLFVVMMLDIKKVKFKDSIAKYSFIPLSILICLIFELYLVANFVVIDQVVSDPINGNISNTKAIGNILYTKYGFIFQLSGIILFVAMIGTIVLTLKKRDSSVRIQSISKQVSRTIDESIEIVNPEIGKGV